MTSRADVVRIHLRIPPGAIAYLKFIFESYEGIGVVRTIDRVSAIIVLIVVPDFLDVARQILDALRDEVAWEEMPDPSPNE